MKPENMKSFEVPNEMRDFASKSVEQARRAFDSFVGAAHKAAENVEDSTEAMHAASRDATRQAIAFAERNVKAGFDLAMAMSQAKGIDDVVRIQSAFMQSQANAMQEQMKAFGETVQRASKPSGE